MASRGEVWWVRFGPGEEGEVKKVRPAVVISNDVANKALNRIVVVPITSSPSEPYPSEALVAVAGRPGKAMCDQVTSVSKQRLRGQIASLTRSELEAVEEALLIHLGITRRLN